MVKKLFKHEFLYYARVMGIVYIILLTVAAATRIIFCFETDTTPYEIISTFTLITYVVSVIAAFGFSFVMGIVRFYRNLFTGEGYLSFTLPVTPSQHIIVKAVTAACVELVTLVMVLISLCIVAAGEALTSFWNELTLAFDIILKDVGGGHLIAMGAEYLMILLLALCSGLLFYYLCISIGQLAKKNRILAAVGAYFGFYILSQIFSTALVISFSISVASGMFDAFGRWLIEQLMNHPYAVIHGGLLIFIALEALFIWLEFFVIKKIITKKLNLE